MPRSVNKLSVLGSLLLATGACWAASLPIDIAIENPSFEVPGRSATNKLLNNVTSWTVSNAGNCNCTYSGQNINPVDGLHVAWSQGGFLYQDLTGINSTFVNDAVYTLSVDVGRPRNAGAAVTPYDLAFWTGGTGAHALATAAGTISNNATWSTYNFLLDTRLIGGVAGQTIRIRLDGGAANAPVFFDNLKLQRVDFAAVPEPVSVVLMGTVAGCLALAVARRRRTSHL